MFQEEFKRKVLEQKKRDRKKKSDKEVAEITKMVEKHESSLKLDVPSIKTGNSNTSVKTASEEKH